MNDSGAPYLVEKVGATVEVKGKYLAARRRERANFAVFGAHIQHRVVVFDRGKHLFHPIRRQRERRQDRERKPISTLLSPSLSTSRTGLTAPFATIGLES